MAGSPMIDRRLRDIRQFHWVIYPNDLDTTRKIGEPPLTVTAGRQNMADPAGLAIAALANCDQAPMPALRVPPSLVGTEGLGARRRHSRAVHKSNLMMVYGGLNSHRGHAPLILGRPRRIMAEREGLLSHLMKPSKTGLFVLSLSQFLYHPSAPVDQQIGGQNPCLRETPCSEIEPHNPFGACGQPRSGTIPTTTAHCRWATSFLILRAPELGRPGRNSWGLQRPLWLPWPGIRSDPGGTQWSG